MIGSYLPESVLSLILVEEYVMKDEEYVLKAVEYVLKAEEYVLSNEDLKGTRIEHRFKRAFISLFGQDVETFTNNVSNSYSQFSLGYDNQMTNKSFSEYTQIKAKDFRDTLLKHMSSIKKSITERARHQRQYERRVNETQLQMQEGEVDMSKALNVDSVVTKSSGTESKNHDTSSDSEMIHMLRMQISNS
ncbi:hypothetical protein Tco_0474653 [Tanacetum coccineum]